MKKPFVAMVHAHGEEEPAFFSAEVAHEAFVGLESKEERVEQLVAQTEEHYKYSMYNVRSESVSVECSV